MLSYVLLMLALIHAGLLLWTLSGDISGNLRLPTLRITFLCALMIGMFYDNLITGLGNFYYDHHWYPTANVPRFVLHAIILPFLPLFAYSLWQQAGGSFRHQNALQYFLVTFTGAAVVYGLYHEVLLLNLGDKSVLGVHKLGNLTAAPPWATIVTNLVFLPLAWLYWRATGWPWMLLGGMFIFLVNGASATQLWGFLAGNFAEVVFIISLLMTERRQRWSKHDTLSLTTKSA